MTFRKHSLAPFPTAVTVQLVSLGRMMEAIGRDGAMLYTEMVAHDNKE